MKFVWKKIEKVAYGDTLYLLIYSEEVFYGKHQKHGHRKVL